MAFNVTVNVNMKEIRKDIRDFADKLCSELVDIGADVVETTYSLYSDDATFDTKVEAQHTKTAGHKIVVSGSQAGFMEFGAGIGASPYPDGTNAGVSYGTYPGSWSESHSQKFSTSGQWYYNKRRYEKVEAAHGIYKARKKIEEVAQDVAKRVQ